MRFLRFLRRHPLILLAAIGVAFVGWIWRDFVTQPAPEARKPNPGPPGLKMQMVVEDLNGDPVWAPPEPPVRIQEPPKNTAQILPKLKPGMTRAEVEGLVGPPAAHHIHPVTVADGRITYHTTYEADLGPASTVRPIHPMARPMGPRQPATVNHGLVTLEFDATKPGHPLLEIYYPDPLF